MGYKSINRLAEDIHNATLLIESGELSLTSLNVLVRNVQALQERLFVLRYKIQEEKTKKTSALKKKLGKEVEIPVLFKVEPIVQDQVHPNQTSLIDIIEEIEEEKKPIEVQSAMFSIVDEPIESVQPVEKEKPKKANKIKTPKPSKTEIKKVVIKNESLVEKLNSAPIHDLKKSINLNLKFRFIKALYNNESDVYNSSIEELNQAGSFEKAKTILMDVKEKYQWDEDVEEEGLLLELLERKYEV